MSTTEATARRDWDWDTDGELDGLYVETRSVTVRNGPSAGQSKLVFDFHHGLNDEPVSAWETTVLRSKFSEELKRRKKPDFEPGERFVITPTGRKTSANGTYRDFHVVFENAAPKPSTAELLAADQPSTEPDAPATDVDIPF